MERGVELALHDAVGPVSGRWAPPRSASAGSGAARHRTSSSRGELILKAAGHAQSEEGASLSHVQLSNEKLRR